MKKNRLLLLSLVVCLVLPSVFGFLDIKTYDEEQQKVTVYNFLGLTDTFSVQMLDNTPQCFKCHTDYRVCNLLVSDMEFSDFNIKFYDELSFIPNKAHITHKLVTDYRTQSVTTYDTCISNEFVYNQNISNDRTKHKVSYDCNPQVTEYQEPYQTWQETDLTKLTLAPEECITIRIEGNLNWGDKVDNRPNLLGFEIDEFAWWDSDFDKCQNITYTGTGTTNLTEFPFLLNVTYDSDMQADYDDLRFLSEPCNEDGSEYSYEIDNHTTARALIWVNILNYTHDGDTFSMYYDNAGASNGEDITGTWNDNFTLVWHMADNTTQSVLDSTQWDRDGYKSGAGAPAIDNTWFALSQNQQFTNDDITSISMITVGSSIPFTVELWAEEISIGTSEYALGLHGAFFRIGNEAQGKFVFGYDKEIGTGQWLLSDMNPDNDLHYHVGKYDLSNVAYLVDGTTDDTSANLPENFTKSILAGGDSTGSGDWDGNIDEFRVSNVARSDDWINLTYANILYNDLMVTFGTEQSEPVANNIPSVTTPTITPDPAYVGNSLNCSSTPTDDENVSLDLRFAWWYNDAVCDGCLYNVTVPTTNNTLTYTTTLVNEALTVGDNWTCLVRAYDGTDWSSWDNSTIQISAAASVPCAPTQGANFALNYSQNCNISFNFDSPTTNITGTGCGQWEIRANVSVNEYNNYCDDGCKCNLSIKGGNSFAHT